MLLYDGEPVALAGKAFDLLVALVSQAGHLMTKDELLRRVWPGLVVEEVNLSVNISAIRKALARSPDAAEWIENVPRQGYRFKAPIEVDDIATLKQAQLRSVATAEPPSPAMSKRTGRQPVWLALGALLALALAVSLGWLAFGRAMPYAAVAVLPFAADTAANAPLADGIAEEAINTLTRVADLRVAPRASAFRFRGVDPLEAGRRLNAPAVVTGSLARDGERLILQVELVDVTRAAQVWASRYEVALAELPQLHGRMMEDLARTLRLRSIAVSQTKRLAQDPTRNGDAYQAYLQGRFLWNQRSEPALRKAIEHFRRAVDLDPLFALAYAALADTYTTLGYLSHDAPAATFPVARPYALKAIELDPSLSQAHASLAYIRFYFDWDWAGASEAFRRAIQLNPNDPVARQWHAVYLLAAGRPDDAMHEIRTAQRLDPLSLAINTDVGFHHYYNGRYAEAIAQLESVLGMRSDFGLAHLWLARSYLEVGRLDQSLAATASAEAAIPEWPVLVAARGYTLGVMSRTDEARAARDEMEQLSGRRFVTAYGVALVHAGLGDKEQALAWLDKAFAERSHWLVWLRLDPRWKTLRGDRRFSELVERMKYPG